MRGNSLYHPVPPFSCVFQFTPLHERQRPTLILLFSESHFNSRLCMRGNQFLARLQAVGIRYFNSRLCMRGNSKGVMNMEEKEIFQFTPLHERQPMQARQIRRQLTFQFMPLHERQRAEYGFPVGLRHISIHAST